MEYRNKKKGLESVRSMKMERSVLQLWGLEDDWSTGQGPRATDFFPKYDVLNTKYGVHGTWYLANKTFGKKLIAFCTAFVFAWSMCVTPVRAEVINLDGGTVDVNVQDNITNWNVTGNPIWNMPEFNVAEGSIYNIAGLGSGASLAVLVNGGSASNIFGGLNLSNLDFILQNIAGINIGASAMINLNNASLIASTLPLNLDATSFANRQYAFSGQGGFLMNEGKIVGDNADLVALVANAIENRGVIEVPMGTVALAAGDTVTVGISPDGMVTIGVDAATANDLGLADQIKNTGTISANGGRVVLNAKAIDGLFDKAIHIDASENATAAIVADDGVIEFISEGDISNVGTLQAERGSITIDTEGEIENQGTIFTKTLREHGYTFRSTGTLKGGDVYMDNTDGAGFLSGTLGSNVTDAGTIIVNGDITLTNSITITAGEAFTMGQEYTLSGDEKNLTISSAGSSTIGKVTGVKDLTLNQNGSAVTYQVRNAVTLSGDLTVNENVTLTGGYSVTVGGGSVTGEGTINMTGGVFTVVGDGTFGGNTDWTFWELYFGEGDVEAVATATSKTGPNKITVLTELKINLNHTLKAGSSNWDLVWGGGYLTDVVKIVAGNAHTLALLSDGTVKGWGSNIFYQLGDGTGGIRANPVSIPGLSGVTDIAAGWGHSLALLSDGTVKSWGYNDCGQLGDGTTNPNATPVSVSDLSGVTAIAAGVYHSLALLSNGTVRAWGYNNSGQLGDGTQTNRLTPVSVSGLAGVTALAAGYYHSLALLSDTTVKSWGFNGEGQLGDGTQTTRLTPVSVLGLSGVTAIAAGDYHSLALLSDGTVKGWGRNGYGEVGVPRTGPCLTAVSVPGLSGVTAIAAGHFHSLALISDGTVRGWGYNNLGQLGDGTTTSYNLTSVKGLSGVTAITAGDYYSLALRSDGTVESWGYNNRGQLGNGSTSTNSLEPVYTIAGLSAGGLLSDISKIVSGINHTLALKSDGSLVYAWGDNQYGQLGTGNLFSASVPVAVLNTEGTGYLTDVIDIAAGGYHSLALLSDETVKSWGYNIDGQLGDGTTTSRLAPVSVLGLSGVTAIAAGDYHSLALLSDETVKSWGYNDHGQLGDGTNTNRSNPVDVKNADGSLLSGILSIAAGAKHSLALLSNDTETKLDDTVKAWGWNNYGQVGDGTTIDRVNPVDVKYADESLLIGVISIAAGDYYSLALLSDTTVKSWGSNFSGELGDGTTTDRLNPVSVSNLSGVTAIAAGGPQSLARLSNGTVKGWGYNGNGELGDGTTTNRLIPVSIPGLSGVTAISVGYLYSLALLSDGTVKSWGANYYGQLGINSSGRETSPQGVVRLSHAPFTIDGNFDAEQSTFQYLGEYGFGISTVIADAEYYNLVLAGELVDYRMSSTLLPPTLEYLESITGGNLTVLGQSRDSGIDLEDAQAKFEEEMRRREEEAKNGGQGGLLPSHLQPDARMQQYDPFRNPMDIGKLITDVRVREGAVYVLDRASGMELVGQGESVRVNFKGEDSPRPTPSAVNDEINRSSGGYATIVNPDKSVFVRCPGGEWQAAKDGMTILPGDEVRTVKGAEAKILLQGGDVGQVEVKGGSFFRITKAETDPKTGDKTTLLDLAIGKVLVHAQKLKGDSKFEVRTPTALTGVRGTTFTVEVKEKA
jgi:filamentous hemagglutinin family protein